MRANQKVKIAVDAGFLESVSSLGTSRVFHRHLERHLRCWPPDNATGNFTKIVQRVPVKILFEHDSLGHLIN